MSSSSSSFLLLAVDRRTVGLEESCGWYWLFNLLINALSIPRPGIYSKSYLEIFTRIVMTWSLIWYDKGGILIKYMCSFKAFAIALWFCSVFLTATKREVRADARMMIAVLLQSVGAKQAGLGISDTFSRVYTECWSFSKSFYFLVEVSLCIL